MQAGRDVMCRQGGREGCAGRSKAELAQVGPGCFYATWTHGFIFHQLHLGLCWVGFALSPCNEMGRNPHPIGERDLRLF